MRLNLPNLYFRRKDNGASVFRISTNGKMGRIEFERIATAVLKSDTIRPHGEIELTDEEMDRIRDWMERQRACSQTELAEELRRISREINLVTHQLSAVDAVDGTLEEATNILLLSLIDIQREIAEKIVLKGTSKA